MIKELTELLDNAAERWKFWENGTVILLSKKQLCEVIARLKELEQLNSNLVDRNLKRSNEIDGLQVRIEELEAHEVDWVKHQIKCKDFNMIVDEEVLIEKKKPFKLFRIPKWMD